MHTTDPVRQACAVAAELFRSYEAQHRRTANEARDSAERTSRLEKAERNQEAAEMLEKALEATPAVRLAALLEDYTATEPDPVAREGEDHDPLARQVNAAARLVADVAQAVPGEADHAVMALARGAGLYLGGQFTTEEALTTECMLLSGAAGQIALELQAQQTATRQ